MSNVRNFGAQGDGQADDTQALQHALDEGEGLVELPRGDYRITKTLTVDLARIGRTSLAGSHGTAKLIMAGPGPALRFVGSHSTSADPLGFRPAEWQQERCPMLAGIEIEGRRPEADGVEIQGVMQPTLLGALIREVRTAVRLTQRARNVLISHCHFYHNSGVGVHLDHVNLHQIIITGSHISYCRLGGIRIEGSEIRNLQITGNDIEYNNHRSFQVPGQEGVPTAEIYIDVGAGSVREGTISGNTLQATYSPHGANIRFLGRSPTENHKGGMWTISGNLIGSQAVNVHLTSVRGIVIEGNCLYSGHQRNLLVEDSRNIVVGPNVFDHNPDYHENELCTGMQFINSVDCTLSGMLIQDCQAGQHTVKDAVPIVRQGLVEFQNCQRFTVSGLQVIDPAPYGLYLENCRDMLFTGCTVLDSRTRPLMLAAVRWKGAQQGNSIAVSRLGQGTEGTVVSEGPLRQVMNS